MEKYIGEKINLFPNDSQYKVARIRDANKHGIEVEILELSRVSWDSKISVGDVIFYPVHKITFKIM